MIGKTPEFCVKKTMKLVSSLSLPPRAHRVLHTFLIGVETIKNTLGAYCIRPTLKVPFYRAYFIRAYAIRPYDLHHNVIVSLLGLLGFRCRDCESIMVLASPFVKGGSRGILLSHRLLIVNNNFLIDQISPNPSLLKRGIKEYFHSLCRYIPAFSQGSSKCRQWHSIVVIVGHECLTYSCPVLSG